MKYLNAFQRRPDNPENSSSAGYFIAAREANTDEEFTDVFIDRALRKFDLKDRPDIKNLCNGRCSCNGKEIQLLEFKGHFFYILYASQVSEDDIFNSILSFCMTLQTGKGLNSDTINKTLLNVEIEQMYKKLFPADKDNRLLRRLIYLSLGELKEKTRAIESFKRYADHTKFDEKTKKEFADYYHGRYKNSNKPTDKGKKTDAHYDFIEKYPDVKIAPNTLRKFLKEYYPDLFSKKS